MELIIEKDLHLPSPPAPLKSSLFCRFRDDVYAVAEEASTFWRGADLFSSSPHLSSPEQRVLHPSADEDKRVARCPP